MNVLLPLLIVTINPDAPIAERYTGATEVFHCPFDPSWDKNFDGEADGWSRRRGRGFPHYVKIQISDESTPVGRGCLRVDLDGGGAVAYTPPIEVSSLYAYVLEAMLQTEGLQHDRAYFSVSLWDKKWKRLEAFRSKKICDSQGWKKLRLGPIEPRRGNVRFAVIGLHLEPGARADLTGTARFTDVWLGRLPRIALLANSLHHVYTDPGEILVTCKASGLPEKDPPIAFCLEDAFGKLLAHQRRRLETSVAVGDVALSDAASSEEQFGLTGSTEWKPPIPGPGFYRVRMTIGGPAEPAYRRQITLAVVELHSGEAGGEFGWSLPEGDKPLPLWELSQLIGHAGIGWVKYPLWYGEETGDDKIQEVIRFAERLTARGIELVGLLHDPPEALREQFPDLESPAEIFTADPQLWYPSLESVMMRLATQVRWWQLGRDRDTAFVAYPKLTEKITEVKDQLDRLSQDASVGFGWGWMNQLPEPADGTPAWQFLALSADPPLTQRELAAYLAVTKTAKLRRWVVLEPLSRSRYPMQVRVGDLVRRMMSAKIHGAEGVFVPDPFSTDHGLMNDDGTVGELFLPWRTTALMLGGSQYLDSIRLPQGSHNLIFARSGDAVMAVWSSHPQQEVIHLGEQVRQVDLWGRTVVPERQEHRQVVRVGPLPTFVTGVDARITRWRKDFSLANDKVPSIVGGQSQNSFHLKNHFETGVSGHLDLVVPEPLEVKPRRIDFHLAGGEELEKDFQITMPYNATSGRHPIRIDFEVHAEQAHRFSVYRHIDVGVGDVYVEIVTRLNDRGELEVQQHVINDTARQVSFRCQLFAPNRRRQKTQIVGMGRGRSVHTYHLADGEQLIGKPLWLRAEQIDGPRVLNYRFLAEG